MAPKGWVAARAAAAEEAARSAVAPMAKLGSLAAGWEGEREADREAAGQKVGEAAAAAGHQEAAVVEASAVARWAAESVHLPSMSLPGGNRRGRRSRCIRRRVPRSHNNLRRHSSSGTSH